MLTRLLAALALMSLGMTTEASAQDWAARFQPVPECRLRVTHHAANPAYGHASLVVRVLVNRDTVYPHAKARIRLLRDSSVAAPSIEGKPQRDSLFRFDDVAPGHYELRVLAIGMSRKPDTLEISPGAVDTASAHLFDFSDAYRNTQNCRPRGFRRPGELACIASGQEVELISRWLRNLAGESEPRPYGLLPFQERQIRVVRDERICERAGRAYGDDDGGSPPRRVIVFDLGRMYLVYDPAEPIPAGEWNIHIFFDRKWKVLTRLMS